MVRRVRRWNTSLGSFVREYTMGRLISSLGGRGVRVTPHAVYSWVSGRSAPRPNTARALVLVSRGRIRFDDLYGRSSRASGKVECSKSR